MSADAALPSFAWNKKGSILTLVIPAHGGCNMACPYCYIAQRGDDGAASELTLDDYTQFIRSIVASRDVACLCIQGYEPLLPGSFPITEAVLRLGQERGIPTSLVTNGTYLARYADQLAALAPGRLSVSLDAAEAAAHDRMRRTPGAFAAAVEGIEAAVAALPADSELVVNSVLFRKQRRRLDAMPTLLKRLGVENWVVTALLKIGKDKIGGPVGRREDILAELRILDRRAREAGISFSADDEFAGLGRFDQPDGELLRIRRLIQPDGVYRLVPDGRCSKGADILKPLSDKTPRWDPKTQDAAAFLAAL